MKRFLVTLCVAVLGLGLGFSSFDAEAKRLGGGKSSGISRDSGVMKRDAAPAAPAQNALPAKPAATPQPAAPQPSGMSRWLGPLAGIAAGVGLAALLSHFGMGEGVANFLMIALLAFAAIFVVRLLFRKRETASPMQYAGVPAGTAPARFEPVAGPVGTTAAPLASSAHIPADFDTEGFLRNAKLNFVRLQAANDVGNLDDIRQFTTPEMYAEIKLEYDERGRVKQETDVVQLNAALLDLTTEAQRHIASVRFSGQIREEANGPVEAFDEVWHLTKPADGSGGWLIAGIQQFQ